MQSNFSVEVRDNGHAVVIGVTGELDLASSPELERELERGPSSDAELLIIDLRGLEFMDSTGLSVLVRAHQKATYGGKRFAVVKGPQLVQRLLSLTGVAERLTVVAPVLGINLQLVAQPPERRADLALRRARQLRAGSRAERPDREVQTAGVGGDPEPDPGRARGLHRVSRQRVGDEVDVRESVERESRSRGEGSSKPAQHAADERQRRERHDRIPREAVRPAVLGRGSAGRVASTASARPRSPTCCP